MQFYDNAQATTIAKMFSFVRTHPRPIQSNIRNRFRPRSSFHHNPQPLVNLPLAFVPHFDKIRLFNAVNLEYGFKPLQIYSPREVTTYGRTND